MEEITRESLRGWTKKLTKAEKGHLRENGVRTTAQLKEQMEWTRDHMQNGGAYCPICVEIGRKLGVIGKQEAEE